MALIRAAALGAVIIALLPSDRQQQEKLYQSVSNAAVWSATFCERNTSMCQTANAGWETFKAKAQFAAVMAWDVALRQAMGNENDMATAALSTAGPPAKLARGTLSESDLEPDWRGAASRKPL